jgi:CHC2 zinc finger
MTAAYVAKALNGRRSGAGWMARCPAHRDRSPSLSIRESDGRLLIHCFAGCTQEDVIVALGGRGLWPERPRPCWTREEKRNYARRHAQARRQAKEALLWQAATIRQLEQAKTAAYVQFLRTPDPLTEQAWADAAQQLFIHANLHGATLAEKYGEAMKLDPVRVRRLTASQREDETGARQCTATVVALLTLKAGAVE